MAKCPFCSSQISEQLAIHGGTCPSCFGQVPGEEAPTDPGAMVRARQEKEDAKTVQRSRVPLLLGVLALSTLLVVAGWVATRPPPEIPVLDFDQLEFAEYDIVATEDPDTEAPAPAPTRVRPRPSGLQELATADGPAIADAGQPDSRRPDRVGGTRMIMDENGDMVPDMDIGGGRPQFGPSSGMDVQMGIDRAGFRGVTLTDDNEIIGMVRAVMESNIPRLQSCYTRQLKADESLRGDWVLTYTLTESGEADGVQVTGETVQDAAMEQCIVRKVQGWNFQPIKEDMDIRKTLRFRPN